MAPSNIWGDVIIHFFIQTLGLRAIFPVFSVQHSQKDCAEEPASMKAKKVCHNEHVQQLCSKATGVSALIDE